MSTTSGQREIDRIRNEYSRRAAALPEEFYSLRWPANQYFHFSVSSAVLRAINEAGMFPLKDRRLLDVGCGEGAWMLDFLRWGARPHNLRGIELDLRRCRLAKERLPAAELVVGDAQHLPWPDESMDIVTQFTVFTSILSGDVKAAVAAEMMRTLKPGGIIVWYDFLVNNPRNPNVRGIALREIRKLFPAADVRSRRVTLAPPISRLLARVSPALPVMLGAIPALCTHTVATIRKRVK